MKINETEKYLQNQIKDADISLDHPRIIDVWTIFKQFSTIKVDCSDSAILFQCGTFTFTGRKAFHFEFLRQYTIEINDEYERMEQLHCEFLFDPTDELNLLKTNLWSYDFFSLDEFFVEVESLKEFQIPVAKYSPLTMNIFQEVV